MKNKIYKTCSCGKVHREIPPEAKTSDLGIFWNCECKSTLFQPSLATSVRMELYKIAKRKAA